MVKTQRSPAQAREAIAILVKVFGVLFLIATIGTGISLVSVNELLANSTHVDGQVIDLTNGAKGTRAPVVQFKIANGETLQLKSDLYTSPGPNVGDTVKVVYRTSNPQDWRIDDSIHLYFWTIMGSIFMFSWAMAITIVKLIGHFRLRNP